MTTITITAETIAKLEAAGFNRWTKCSMDRLYINAKGYGVTYTRYASGKVSGGEFAGESFGACEARNFEATKVYIDLKTGELSITTRTDFEDAIRAAVESIIAEATKEDVTEETIEDTDAIRESIVSVIREQTERVIAATSATAEVAAKAREGAEGMVAKVMGASVERIVENRNLASMDATTVFATVYAW